MASNSQSRALRDIPLDNQEAQSDWLGKGDECQIVRDISTLRLIVVKSQSDPRPGRHSALVGAS